MKAMDDEKFYEMALPYIQKTIHRPLDFKKIAAMVKTRIEVFPDIADLIDFFEEVPEYDASMYTHKKMKTNEETSLALLQEVNRCWQRRKISAMMLSLRCSAHSEKKKDTRPVILCGRSVPLFPENR